MKTSPLVQKMDQINSEIAVRSGRIARMRLASLHDRDLERQSLNKLAQFYVQISAAGRTGKLHV